MLVTFVMFVGIAAALLLAIVGMRRPSARKALKRRVELIRERHGDVIAGNAQAQIRRLLAARSASKFEGWATTIIPKPAPIVLSASRRVQGCVWISPQPW